MRFTKTKIKDLIILEPKIFGDDRGYFIESYNKKTFEDIVGEILFVQDNESKSSKGVLRGLHFQNPPYDQSKLVRCISGKILDVAVDIRKKSKTFGSHFKIILSSTNKKQLFIPKGFAHGFLVLTESAIVNYKVDNMYSPNHDNGIRWNDPKLNIDWGKKLNLNISKKDKELPFFDHCNNPF